VNDCCPYFSWIWLSPLSYSSTKGTSAEFRTPKFEVSYLFIIYFIKEVCLFLKNVTNGIVNYRLLTAVLNHAGILRAKLMKKVHGI
jgi:hypothetical protein